MRGTIFADPRRPCSRCGKAHPEHRLRDILDGDGDDGLVQYDVQVDQWRESEILFGAPRCWGCCTETEQHVILIGLLSDAA
jgi:hypothetical protein